MSPTPLVHVIFGKCGYGPGSVLLVGWDNGHTGVECSLWSDNLVFHTNCHIINAATSHMACMYNMMPFSSKWHTKHPPKLFCDWCKVFWLVGWQLQIVTNTSCNILTALCWSVMSLSSCGGSPMSMNQPKCTGASTRCVPPSNGQHSLQTHITSCKSCELGDGEQGNTPGHPQGTQETGWVQPPT